MVDKKTHVIITPEGHLDIVAWLEKIKHVYYLHDIDLITTIAEEIQVLGKDGKTFYGKSCIEESLSIAEILLNLKVDQNTVVSGMLIPIIRYTPHTLEKIKDHLPKEAYQRLEGLMHLEDLKHIQRNIVEQHDYTQIDRLRKMILSLVHDVRIILMRLSEQMVMMRGIKDINPLERQRLAQETRDIYAPIANRLGIGQLKWELEDLSMRYLDPITYKSISHYLAERRTDREIRIQAMIFRIKECLDEEGILNDISGRAKHINSIFNKMQAKNLTLKNIYDISAIRIIVPTIEDCYSALSVVHSLWEHEPKEFDDYIATPKPNGYRSIHTAVIGSDGKHYEVQIRSQDMHEESERGIAAHWLYKEGNIHLSDKTDKTKVNFLRQLLDWHTNTQAVEENHHVDEEIYTLTPQGKIIDLPVGSTPIDFAYCIHTNVGHHCRGAKVNGHIVPLTHVLHTGDHVEIHTIAEGGPSRDWLMHDGKYVKSSRARSKIAAWFKQHDHTVEIKPEREIIKKNPESKIPTTPPKAKESNSGFLIAGSGDFLTRIARCCKPIPPEAIMGYITYGKGISIHKNDCHNLRSIDLKRMINITWDQAYGGAYAVDLDIYARRSSDLLKEITGVFSNAKINLIAMRSLLGHNQENLWVSVTIQIHNTMELTQTMEQLKQLPLIIEVKRKR